MRSFCATRYIGSCACTVRDTKDLIKFGIKRCWSNFISTHIRVTEKLTVFLIRLRHKHIQVSEKYIVQYNSPISLSKTLIYIPNYSTTRFDPDTENRKACVYEVCPKGFATLFLMREIHYIIP